MDANSLSLPTAFADNLKVYREQILMDMCQLADRLHQAQLLLDRGNEDKAAVLVRQALSQCEKMTLTI